MLDNRITSQVQLGALTLPGTPNQACSITSGLRNSTANRKPSCVQLTVAERAPEIAENYQD
jgi:hypothetical protein